MFLLLLTSHCNVAAAFLYHSVSFEVLNAGRDNHDHVHLMKTAYGSLRNMVSFLLHGNLKDLT